MKNKEKEGGGGGKEGGGVLPSNVYKRLLKYHQNEIYEIKSSLNGGLVGTVSGDRSLKVYDTINH